MFQRRLVLAAAAAGLCGCSAAPLHAASGSLVELQLIDRERGLALPTHRHRGSTWVEGRPGARYAVRLVNRSGARVLAVLSVDGINAISGATAATSQTGYVLDPWQSADITGWRKSDAEAAAFYFTALPDSYAARTNRPGHVGVVGVAVFREREPPPPPPQAFEPAPWSGGRDESRSSNLADNRQRRESNPAAAAAPARESDAAGLARQDKLGTGHGEREYAPISRTAFERATSQPAQIVQLRYDSRANLVAAGVIAPPWRGRPEPFPGFVPDPQ
jgi:hypothetical protein